MVRHASSHKTKRQVIWNKTKGYCWYCGIGIPLEAFTIDHVVPQKYGFADRNFTRNLVPCCEPCNRMKGDKRMADFRKYLHKQINWERRIIFWFEDRKRCGTWLKPKKSPRNQ